MSSPSSNFWVPRWLLYCLWNPGLSIWPIIFQLLHFISLLSGFISTLSRSTSLLTRSCHLTRMILHRQVFWNSSSALLSPSFVFQVWHPYSKTGSIRALINGNFSLVETLPDLQLILTCTNVLLVFKIVFFSSFMPPFSLLTVAL